MRVLLLGGSRFMGRYALEALLEGGHEVVVLNRGTRPAPDHDRVTVIVADRNDPAAMSRVRDAKPDAVLDFSSYTPTQARHLVDVLPDVDRFVFISTGAVYRPGPVLPWPETSPMGPWELWGGYAADKLAAERVVLSAREGRPTVILRFPYVLGPGNYADREEFLFNRLLDGAALFLPGDGTAVQQMVTAKDAARAAARALSIAGLDGAFNVAHPVELVSLAGLVELCAEVAKRDAVVRTVGGGPTGLGAGAFDAGNAVFPFPSVNYVLDVRAADRLGLLAGATGIRDSLAEALEYLLAHPERRRWSRTAAERSVGAAT